MTRKNIELQIAILLAFGVGILSFMFIEIKTPLAIITFYLNSIKPYVLWVGIFCFIPPLINLLCQVFSKDEKEYNEKSYYKLLKFFSHLSILILGTFNLGFIWALMLVGLTLLSNLKTAFVISSIIIFVSIFFIDALTQKYFRIKYYDIFHWIR